MRGRWSRKIARRGGASMAPETEDLRGTGSGDNQDGLHLGLKEDEEQAVRCTSMEPATRGPSRCRRWGRPPSWAQGRRGLGAARRLSMARPRPAAVGEVEKSGDCTRGRLWLLPAT